VRAGSSEEVRRDEDGGQALLETTQRIVDRAGGEEEVEAFAMRSVETEVEALRGEVDQLSSAETRGLGVRVIADGRQGYASTADLSAEGLRGVLEEARSNAAVATADDANVLPDPQDPPEVEGTLVASVRGTPVDDKIALALALEAAATGESGDVRGVDVAKYGDSYTEAAIASTRGLSLRAARSDAWAFVMALASRGDETQTGLGVTIARGPDGLDVERAGRDGARRALRLLGATKPESRRAAVVLDPFATASFLGVLAGALSAEAVLKGRSLFADRLGEDVAGAAVTLVDDGLLAGGLGTSPWDGEGVPQQRTDLIASGQLRTFLHNTWTAHRTDVGARSTGNASRSSYRSSPGVSPTNLYLEPGDLAQEQVLAEAGEGIYIQDVVGIHSGANPISGEFSVGITGLAIRGGELAEPIREATAASTIVEMLRSIRTVGSDLRFLPFGGALGGSSVLIDEMTLAGR
jgi:PmbA protein